MKITLVRHAEVIEEYIGKYNGHIDIPLSQKGRDDAKKLAEELKYEKFDKIYCSDLLRAKETLDAFDYNTKPVYSKKLREKSWGKHEGKSFDEIQKEGIEYLNFEQWINSLDGESIQEFKERIENYFYKTICEESLENILIITHAGVIKTLISIIKNTPLNEAFLIKLPYASYITFDRKNMTFILP